MSDRYVTVEQYQFLPEAQAVQLHLQSEGIPVQLADAETVSTDWALGNAIGYIKLQVPESRAEEATKILNDLRARRLEREKSPEVDDAGQCLSCGHTLQSDEVKCPACGWSFADTDSPAKGDGEKLSAKPTGESDDSLLDNLRALKRPLIMIFVVPMVLAIAMTFLLILMMTIELFVGD